MNIPTATYRIQFRNGMTFDRAAGLVPYLQRLGISHLYASPLFAATAESTHGYDVTDVNQLEPSLGGREGFLRLVNTLKQAGLGLIIDIVPNHMAASLENPWWRDVIENGEHSRYARHFDIDWSRPLTLPFLGDSFASLVENGEITLEAHPQTGKPVFAYHNNYYPLAADSWQGRKDEVLALTDKTAIVKLHQCQPYRLMCWREAPRDLSYRRFFEITGLVGVRVEDPAVFDDTHRLILELVHSGAVDGLRVDHVDGLADPKAYLERLRREAGPDCYITVEKILAEGERLPADWPVSGTTGYEFVASLSAVLVDGENIDELRRAYDQAVGQPVDMAAELRAAKLLMAEKNFEGEFTRLVNIALSIAATDTLKLAEGLVHSALRELLVAFPVYRTYGTGQGLTPADLSLLQKVATEVSAGDNPPAPAALDFIVRIMTGDVSVAARQAAATFCSRCQQLTGPLMAKSVEDTLFFRQHAALALNEVGAEPLPQPFSPAQFHRDMQTRLERQPAGLSTTSTHDTKRGEDARARLYTLSEAPDLWAASVARWRQINHGHIRMLDDGPAPEPAVEWMLYQALAGVWPTTLQPGDAQGLSALAERFAAYVEKALREAKLRTNWGDGNQDYEQAVIDYARHLLSPADPAFLQDFCTTLQPFIRAGLLNSLTQTLIKLTAPGVPDIYQGSETCDLSLADPDNRREPDFAALAGLLDEPLPPGAATEQHWLLGQVKQQAIARLLAVRQQWPALFAEGDYLPLTVSGEQAQNLLAFARVKGDECLIVIVPRVVYRLLEGSLADQYVLRWTEAEIVLPSPLAHRRYHDILSGESLVVTDRVDLASSAGGVARVLRSAAADIG